MALYSNHTIRCLTAGILFLAALILQVNVAYACEQMGGMPRTVCCCEDMAVNTCKDGHNHKDHGHKQEIESQKPCCDVTVVPRDDASLSKTDVVGSPAKLHLKPSQPTYLIPPPEAALPVLRTPPHPEPEAVFASLPGSDTYLLTQRFRE